MRTLTEPEALQFRKWWRDGLALARIAERMGQDFGRPMTITGVSRTATEMGLPTRRNRWTETQNWRLAELWLDKTKRPAEIARTLSKEMGRPISENAVTVRVHNLGLPSRRDMK